ncbi:MAG: formylglycine-generating enzyme family protein [Cyanobacteria bacterium SBLK]|nr:formylglycine-generating enzyme family protein [Cyanobacteria bacterium SBLK]
MSDAVSPPSLKRFLDRLDRSGLLKRLDLSDEDIADSLWLALQMGAVKPQYNEVEESETSSQPLEVIRQETPPREPQEPSISVYTEESTREEEGFSSPQGYPIRVPAAPALPNALQIGRSLRPLMRKVPSPTRTILDEEGTVARIAEREIWIPATRPEPERWLNLELVVEESRSLFIWRETIDELQHILETHGAFRNVRTWSLRDAGGQELQLVRRHKGKKGGQRQHGHRELIHPHRRGAIVLISDCTSPLWQQARIHGWLRDWSESVPVTLLQLFPERLWDSTYLGAGTKFFARASTPGAIAQKLTFEGLPTWLPVDWPNTLALTVSTLEPDFLQAWSRVVSGSGNARIPAFLFDLELLRQEKRTDKNEVKTGEGDRSRQPERRVERFLATASLSARRLAGMMAAAPVDMSVVNLIRETLLPEAQTVHVAEVYMGGLLRVVKEDADEKRRVYDFLPGVRKVLNRALGKRETERVLDRISQHIAKEIDSPIRSFRALLALFPEQNRDRVLPFARVALGVLENLGGDCAAFAREVSPRIIGDRSVVAAQTVEPVEFEESFSLAWIEVEETHTFEFDVATLEKRSRFLGFGDRWVIKKERRTAIGFVEELGEGVQIELMEIPAGTFLMGSPEGELERRRSESPQHEVNVPSFYMGRYPVTQEQWRVVADWEQVERELDPDPSYFKEDYEKQSRWQRPVENVSWLDAKEFCARLTQRTEKEYRLPTEAEWEYACRAPSPLAPLPKLGEGNYPPFHFGETITTDLANYRGTDNKDLAWKGNYGRGPKGEYRKQTTPVGYFKVANEFGLYDMHGNVWEWCEDDWHENYTDAPVDGSAWLTGDKDTTKVLRGGSWSRDPRLCRSACRSSGYRANRYYFNGFCIVRLPPRTL